MIASTSELGWRVAIWIPYKPLHVLFHHKQLVIPCPTNSTAMRLQCVVEKYMDLLCLNISCVVSGDDNSFGAWLCAHVHIKYVETPRIHPWARFLLCQFFKCILCFLFLIPLYLVFTFLDGISVCLIISKGYNLHLCSCSWRLDKTSNFDVWRERSSNGLSNYGKKKWVL